MMHDKKQIEIRRAKKESLYYRELSGLFLRMTLDEPLLKDLHISSVKLSPDKGVCTLFFFSSKGREGFKHDLPSLILYKPSLRKALSQNIRSRYTPQLVFKYDENFEKQCKLDSLFDQLKVEGKF